jgi:long-chain fatty acid transport protein
VGAFYKSKVWSGKFDKYSGLFAQGGGFDVPASWGGGVAIKATDRLTVAADVKRIEYSDVQSVGNSIAPLFQGVPFGAEGAPGFGWKDITVGKFGAVFDANDRLTVRAGYSIGGNPVPQSETLLNILAPGVVTEHFTAGATIKTGSNMELSAYAMHAPRNTVRGTGSIPANFGGGEADIRLSEISFGVAAGFTF